MNFKYVPTIAIFLLSLAVVCMPAMATVRNVVNFGATGNGTTDDTSAINSAISALQAGDELFFPCPSSYYKISSTLSNIRANNVTVDGQTGCGNGRVTIKYAGGAADIWQIGNSSHTSPINLNSASTELGTTLQANWSNIGLAAGDYISIVQGGIGGNTNAGVYASTATQCDTSSCRGEILKIASVSGTTATVTTALHDTYDPANISPGNTNFGSASDLPEGIVKITAPLSGLNFHDLKLDGGGLANRNLWLHENVNYTISNVTFTNATDSVLPESGFNGTWSNITLTTVGCNDFGIDFIGNGHLTVNGLTTSGSDGAWCTNPLAGSNGMAVKQTADSSFTNILIDKNGISGGRPYKNVGARYNTFNSLTVENSNGCWNGIDIGYYSSHNTWTNSSSINNGCGAGGGGAGYNSFGNFNQYNTLNNLTITGNGNVALVAYGGCIPNTSTCFHYDTHLTISGGTIGQGANSSGAYVILAVDNTYVHDVAISGPGNPGIQINGSNACINNNTFTTLGGMGILVSGSNNVGSGNTLNGFGSNLTTGVCGTVNQPAAPTGLTATVI